MSPRPLWQPAAHITAAPSKYQRPALVLAAAYRDPARRASQTALRAAVAIEFVHIATLRHAEMIGAGEQPRGIYSTTAKWGNATAILAGDALVARAFSLAAEINAGPTSTLGAAYLHVCAGHQLDIESRYDLARDEASYFRTIEAKTGTLFACACAVGARLGNYGDDVSLALFEFGKAFGTAYQLLDDVWDILPAPHLAKPPLANIRRGIYTLPIIRIAADSAVLRRILRRHDDVSVDEVGAAIRAHADAITSTLQATYDHLRRARRHLRHALPEASMSAFYEHSCQRLRDAATATGRWLEATERG